MMMESLLVSAVVPAFDRARKTQRAIESVAHQTHTPIELIIVDDGSDPPLANSLDLPERVQRSKIIRFDENRGANAARNAGIEASNGEYIAFLDSDDEWKPDKIRRQIEILQKSSAQASYTAVEHVNDQGRLNAISSANYAGDLRPSLLKGNIIGSFSSFIIERQSIREVGKTDPSLPCWQDWEWYLRLSKCIEFEPVDKPLVRRHNEGDQISRSFAPKRNEAYPVLRDLLAQIAENKYERRIALSSIDYRLGYSALVNKEYSIARRLFIQSLLRNPLNAKCLKYLSVSGNHYPVMRKLKRSVVRAVN